MKREYFRKNRIFVGLQKIAGERDIMKKISVLLCMALLFASCTRDNNWLTQKKISFTVSTKNLSATKSSDLVYLRTIEVPGPTDSDMLYLHVYETNLTDPSLSITTRGAIATTSGINVDGQSFLVDAYLKAATSDGAPEHYMDAVEVTRSSGKWVISGAYNWYNEVPIDFWAHYPSDVSLNSLEINDGISAADPYLSFVYSRESVTDGSATQSMQDILLAHKQQTGGTVALEFAHVFSGLCMKNQISASGVSVKSLTLRGVHKGGTCTFDGNHVVWSNLKDGAVYTQNYTSNSQLEDEGNSFFVVPQTLGNGCSLEMKISIDDVEQSRTAYLWEEGADRSWIAGKRYTYYLSYSAKPSKLYVIEDVPDLTIPFYGSEGISARFESFCMDADDPSSKENLRADAWVSYDGGVNWYSPEQIEEFDDCGSYPEDFWGVGYAWWDDDHEENVIEIGAGFNSSAEVSSASKIASHAAELASRPVKGSPFSPFDLSRCTVKGDVRETVVTANSYVVGSPGCFVFPLVYGNAIDQVVSPEGANEGAYIFSPSYERLAHFVNVRGSEISSPYIEDDLGYTTSDLSACVVWQDVPSGCEIIKNVAIVPAIDVPTATLPCSYLRFSISPEDIRSGNAVLAVRKDGKILWSWHIWITDLVLEPKDVNTPFGKSSIMPCFMGWVPDGPERYVAEDRSFLIKLRQYESVETKGDDTPAIKIYTGAETVFTLTQQGGNFVITEPSGSATYYQDGRKDAFLPVVGGYSDLNKSWTSEEYVIASDAYSVVSANIPTLDDVATLIANPYVMYYNRSTDKDGDVCMNNWSRWSIRNYWGASESDGIEAAVKTIYDPCPPGYRMPLQDIFSFMVYGSECKGNEDLVDLNSRFCAEDINTAYQRSSHAGGWFFYTDRMPASGMWNTSSEEIFCPFLGNRSLETGSIQSFSYTSSSYTNLESYEGARAWKFSLVDNFSPSGHGYNGLSPVIPMADSHMGYFHVGGSLSWTEREEDIDIAY